MRAIGYAGAVRIGDGGRQASGYTRSLEFLDVAPYRVSQAQFGDNDSLIRENLPFLAGDSSRN